MLYVSQITTKTTLRIILCLFRYDRDNNSFLDLMELKYMMEKLRAPQTHIGLKQMIKEVDEDHDDKVSFREVRTCIHALLRTTCFLNNNKDHLHLRTSGFSSLAKHIVQA